MYKNCFIGCSGYYYPFWKNKFYPKGLAPKNWLAYYSSVFNTVELNSTFYRTPKLADLEKYRQVTKPDFTFSIKMSRSITHINRLKGGKQQISDFQSLVKEGLSTKLNYFLFQMPPSFLYNEENLERIVTNISHNSCNVIEFRHASWWNEQVKKVLTDAKLTFCNVDYPGLKSEFISTSSIFYLRMHGNPNLFKSAYSENELKRFYERFPKDCLDYRVYFNNTYYEAAYTNALQLIEITKPK